MNGNKGNVYEIRFYDAKTHHLRSIVGRIDRKQLNEFNSNEHSFIDFIKTFHPPVFNHDIKEIVVYYECETYRVENGNLEYGSSSVSMDKAKV